MELKQFLLYLGIFLGLAIVAYLITRLFIQNRMLVSTPATDTDLEADQYYYLPGYGLNLSVNASIQITTKQLLRLDVTPEIVLQADTRTLITLNYITDPFSSDELKIVTSPASLLQNISVESTDKLASIVNLLTEAAKDQAQTYRESVALAPEIIQVAKTFRLSPEDLATGEKTLELDENVFVKLKNKTFAGDVTLPKEYGGIFTRPMCNQTWEMLAPANKVMASFTCYAPDFSRIIKVPVRRAYFSRRQQLPGFCNGVLVENQITRHSEMEGLVSVPLNILKGIVSIPAQLFQFRIIRNRPAKDEAALDAMKEEMKELAAKVNKLTDTITASRV